MARYALIDADGNVTNVIAWDGGGDWHPPEGATAVLLDGDDTPPVAERARGKPDRALPDAAIARLPAHVSPGGRFADGVYTPPPDPDEDI